jgi:hypothetical protein
VLVLIPDGVGGWHWALPILILSPIFLLPFWRCVLMLCWALSLVPALAAYLTWIVLVALCVRLAGGWPSGAPGWALCWGQ